MHASLDVNELLRRHAASCGMLRNKRHNMPHHTVTQRVRCEHSHWILCICLVWHCLNATHRIRRERTFSHIALHQEFVRLLAAGRFISFGHIVTLL